MSIEYTDPKGNLCRACISTKTNGLFGITYMRPGSAFNSFSDNINVDQPHEQVWYFQRQDGLYGFTIRNVGNERPILLYARSEEEAKRIRAELITAFSILS